MTTDFTFLFPLSDNHALTVSGVNTAHVLLEGNVFDNVPHPYEKSDHQGYLYASTSSSTACQATFKRSCLANSFINGSPGFSSGDSGVIGDFSGESYVQPIALNQVESHVQSNAGFGKI